MSTPTAEFVGPVPQPDWESIRPAHDRDRREWGIRELGIDFTATPASSGAPAWDVLGTDDEGREIAYSNCELLQDPENPKRFDIVRQFVTKHKKELIIGIAGGAALAMTGTGVVAFQKHRSRQ